MNKIKSLFKASPIAVAVAGLAILAIAGVASAALVNYLSNYTTATTTVSSPITMSINKGVDGTTQGNTVIDIGNTFGGQDITFTTVAQNNVNKEIKGYNVMVLKETDGKKMTGNEIVHLAYQDNQPTNEPDIISSLVVVEANGTLTPLATYISANRSDPKLVLMSNYSGVGSGYAPNSTQDLSTIPASSVFWSVYTATLNEAAVGTYAVYSQFVAGTPSDLAAYAASQYSNF